MTRVGIDYRAMQIGHQFRGIGSVLRNVCAGIAVSNKVEDTEFILFTEGPVDGYADREAKSIFKGANYRYCSLGDSRSRNEKILYSLPKRQEKIIERSCDKFIQFDFSLGLPKKVESLLVMHDFIPYELGNRYPNTYLPEYRKARRAGLHRKHALQQKIRREVYIRNVKDALRRADRIITVSGFTAKRVKEIAKEFNIDLDPNIIISSFLGASSVKGNKKEMDHFEKHIIRGYGLDKSPFIFWIGGADDRRRIDLLVQAFNRIRATGKELKLVLAGLDFISIDSIYNVKAKEAILKSSYKEDIILLGYISDEQRNFLYEKAEAFVFPTESEGFGLPLVEALLLGTSVVCFKNTSLVELIGDNCFPCKESAIGLSEAIINCLERSDEEKQKDKEAGILWAKKFTYADFVEKVNEFIKHR